MGVKSDKIYYMVEKEYLAFFGSVTRVMKAEKILKNEGIGFVLMPSPRTIPSPCGLAIRLKEEDVKGGQKVLEERKMKITHLYLKEDSGYRKVY